MKLDKEYNEYQEISITDKDLIQDFITSHTKIWEEDIIKFNNLKELINIDNIKSLDFYSYSGINEEIEYQFILNDNTIKNFYLDKELIIKWLIKNNLIN